MVALTVIHAFDGHDIGARLVEPAVVKAALASHRSHVSPTPLTEADKAELERLKAERASAKHEAADASADEAVDTIAKAVAPAPDTKTGKR